MIKNIFLIVLTLFVFNFASAQKNETSNVYFLRSTGFFGTVIPFKIFINGVKVCDLNNKRYSIHNLPIGKHECSVTFRGSNQNQKCVIFVEPNITKYVQFYFRDDVFDFKTFSPKE